MNVRRIKKKGKEMKNGQRNILRNNIFILFQITDL